MQAPPPPGQMPSNYPRPDLTDGRQALREIAAGQRQVIYCVLGQIGYVAINMAGASAHMVAVVLASYVLALVLLVFMLLSVSRLAKALGMSTVLCIILMFIPCVSLITLLVLSGKANARLQQAGVKVGLLGADPNSI